MLKRNKSCETCADAPERGSYALECQSCSNWWPNLWREKTCDNCRHDARDPAEVPCCDCKHGLGDSAAAPLLWAASEQRPTNRGSGAAK